MLLFRTLTSFQFPVACDGDDEVAGQQLNGQQFTMSATKVNILVPVRDDVKVLCAKIQSQDSALKLHGVLNERLPNLEQLHLERVPADGDDAVHAPRSEPPYTLRAANLPKLQILAAVDTIVSLEMPLCRNLRMLHLEFDDQKKVDRVPLARFLDIMRNCTSLQSLYEYCYVDARTPRGTAPPPVLSLMGHTRLKVLQILEDSGTLSRILSSLIIPASVNVTAVAVVGEKPVLRDVFPRDRTQLQILQQATKVEARHTLRDCFLAAHMPGKESGCLTLELSTTSEGMRRTERDLRDGMLLHTMIQSLDIFKDCPARTLCLGGNLAQVRPESWIATFSRFPDIEELVLEDIQDQPGNTLFALFDALTVHSNAHRGVSVPRLQTFKLEGAINQPGLLDAIRSCFTRRAQLGARSLHRMELIPSRGSNRGWTADEVARFRREQHTLAKIVDVKI